MQTAYTKTILQNNMYQNPVLMKLLYYGTLAPSTHNAQMWKVKILSENEFAIILDNDRTLKFVDYDNREAFISIGAFLANIIRGAETSELDIHYAVYDEIQPDNSVVYVSFEKTADEISSESAKNFEKLLLKRKTSKEKFSNKKISKQEINEIIKGYEDSIVYFPRGSTAFNYIRENTVKAYEVQGRNADKREELSEWFRFSDKETSLKKDGLSAEMLGMGAFKKFFYYQLYNKEKIKDIKFLDEELKLIKAQADTAQGFLLITVDGNSVKENIYAGIVLENIWLNAADKDIKIQPLSPILEEEPFKNNISSDLKINREVKMILRAGYSSNNKKVKKVRRSVEDILVNTENQIIEEDK